MDRQNGRGLQSRCWAFLVADSCRLNVGGAGGTFLVFADQHPGIGEGDLRVGTATVTEAAVLAGPPNGEPGPPLSTTISVRQRKVQVDRLIETFIARSVPLDRFQTSLALALT